MLLVMGIILACAISFGIANTRHLPDREFIESTKLQHTFRLITPRYEKKVLILTIILMPFIFIVEVILFLLFKLYTG